MSMDELLEQLAAEIKDEDVKNAQSSASKMRDTSDMKMYGPLRMFATDTANKS
ncbi:hypothetical protein SAMN04488112_108177 [Melghirimyces thermohalophilus]|uniref:Uncharacterized protein n=1 Tax=Melghirimyces thermohalophilus TaxID=1236220 RepID=A0A1G6LY37_9BACL|nr:hypothetical protein [Melghirimyces thermohalophilus]SDC48141.1 hypothetical protein SAMN04488112_108177 [Melghirimyces thermohalophilus]